MPFSSALQRLVLLTSAPRGGVAVAVLLFGCKPVDSAPPALDAVVQSAWDVWHLEVDDLSSTARHEALDALAADILTLADTELAEVDLVDGSMAPLTEAQRDLVPLVPRALGDDANTEVLPDPAAARPMMLLSRYACTPEKLARILYHLPQDTLYDGVYDRYERSHTTSLADFESGEADSIRWTAELDASVALVGSYTQTLVGGLHRSPNGTLATRTFLPQPAVWEREGRAFNQDYQIEVYVPVQGEQGPEIVHLYGLWREMDLGPLGTTESDVVVRTILNNLAKWDERTEELCADPEVLP